MGLLSCETGNVESLLALANTTVLRCVQPCPPWEAKWTDVGRGSTSQGCARAVGELQPNVMEKAEERVPERHSLREAEFAGILPGVPH